MGMQRLRRSRAGLGLDSRAICHVYLAVALSIASLFAPVSASTNGFAAEPELMLIEVLRTSNDDSCTWGEMRAAGAHVGLTMELPWKDNQRSVSRIPAGTYDGSLRYDKSDGWRVQVEGVKNRSGIQIHIGNWPSQTKGCILVGLRKAEKGCQLLDSQRAYARLRAAFYGSEDPDSTPHRRIRIRIDDPTE